MRLGGQKIGLGSGGMFSRAAASINCCRRCGVNFRAAGLFEIECGRCRSGDSKNNSGDDGCRNSPAKTMVEVARKRPLADVTNFQQAEPEQQQLPVPDSGQEAANKSCEPDACMFCEMDLALMTSNEKDLHLRECLGAFEAQRTQQDGRPASLSAIRAPEYECIICGRCLDNRDLTQRLSHVKRCGHNHHMTVRDLIEMMRTHEDEPDTPGDDQPQESEDAAQLHDNQQEDQLCGDAERCGEEGTGATAGPSYSAFDMMMASSKAQKLNEVSSSKPKASKRPRHSIGGPQSASKFPPPVPSGGATPYCPSYKKVVVSSMPVPLIVDGFKHANPHLSHVYFLSHFHSDHYMGLKASFNEGIIYCSHVTAALVSSRIKVQRQQLCPLALETPADIPVGETSVRVTLVDANHCPGSAMMLFEMPNRTRVLHTGDFRWSRTEMQKSRTMRQLMDDAAGGHPIDVCYLDTTYLAPQYTFPLQEQAIAEVVEAVRSHLAEPDGRKVLFLFGAYQIGKERVFMQVAREFEMPVYVDKQRYRNISCYGWPLQEMKLITQEQSKSNLWVVPMNQLTFKALAGIKSKTQATYTQIVAFKPTGWCFDRRSKQLLSVQRQKGVTLYSVPYSEHSSYSELADFMACIRPKRVVPTVNCSTQEKVGEQLKILKQFHASATDNQSEF